MRDSCFENGRERERDSVGLEVKLWLNQSDDQ